MPARKKSDPVEQSTDKKPAPKKPAARKPKLKTVEAVPATAAPETVGVPVEMLSQLMAQIQTLTQEVGQLKSQVSEPVVAAEPLGPVTQNEIDEAERNPDLMPDDFFAEELPEVEVEAVPLDTEKFEENNPGMLAEIESFNSGEGIKESLSLGELTQAEIDLAEADPDQMPDDFYESGDEEETVAETPEIDLTAFEEQNPGLLAEIESFNAASEDSEDGDAITAEEAGALLAGFDEAMREPEVAETEAESRDLSADEIAAMFASSDTAEPFVEAAEESGDLSADEIAAMFASSDKAEPVVEAAEEGGDLSADEIAAMFASSDAVEPVVETVAEETLSDDDIAMAVDLGASSGGGFDMDLSDEDLDDLTEEDLVALVRQNIDSQAEGIDSASEDVAAFESFDFSAAASGEPISTSEPEPEPVAESDGGGVMSAAEIAALLQTPDAEGDVVPSESSAMSDDELRALLMQSDDDSEEAVPTADDLDNTISFVQPEESATEPVQLQAAQPRTKSSGDEPEIGVIKAVPAHLAIRAMALPMRFEEGKILCLVAEPVDRTAVDRLSKEIGFGIVIQTASIDQVISGLRKAYAEVQDTHARFAVMSGAQKRPSFAQKIAGMWKKSA